ncbi:hypothetical protein ACFX2C_030632 [Malus domestica]
MATPKDAYPMPISDLLIDAAVNHDMLSFIDGHAGYNQIFITEADVHKTAFRCPGVLGTYELVVMPFDLKNAGATYQRVMNTIFHDLIGTTIEVYIDDVVVKSKSRQTLCLALFFVASKLHIICSHPLHRSSPRQMSFDICLLSQ